jgi:streptogramin lyase
MQENKRNVMIKKYILTFLTLEILTSGIILSQVTQEWIRRYPDTLGGWGTGNAITNDNLSSIYITGLVILNNYRYCCTIKYNTDGNVKWMKLYAGSNPAGKSTRIIVVDKFLNVIVTGGENIPGYSSNYLTIKYDSLGNEKWVKHYNGTANDEDNAVSMVLDIAGNIYVTGSTSLGGNSFVYCTIKYNTNGDELWVRTYGVPSPSSQPYAMAVDDDCNIYITGMNNNSAVTVSYYSSGNVRWSRSYAYSTGYAIALDANSNVFITGVTRDSIINGHDYLTIKYSSNGTEQWVRKYTYCTEWGCDNYAQLLAVDKAGNIYVSGRGFKNMSGNSNFCTIKYSNDGDSIWVNTYSVINVSPSDIAMTIDSLSNIYITASIPDTICGSWGYFTMRYDSAGTLCWTTRYCVNPMLGAGSRGITVDNTGNVYVTGGAGVVGSFNQTDMTTIKYSQPTGIKVISAIVPKSFKLYQNYPNPFNPVTKIKFDIPSNVKPEMSKVKCIIYDLLGREIEILINRNLKAGSYEVEWNAEGFSSGIYFYTLISNDYRETMKMVVVK